MEIQGYPGYLIYDDGRVWSKPRKDSIGRPVKGRFLEPAKNHDGYHRVCLCRDGKQKTFLVSRLVAIHYIPNPENKAEVDHISRNVHDNRVSNLRWVTRQENQENKGMRNDNISGHKYISYHKRNERWTFTYRKRGNKINKTFRTKQDAICYKFFFLLKLKSERG